MKKTLSGLSIILVLMIAAATFTAFTHQEKNKNKNEQQKQEKNQDKKDKAAKGNEKSDQGNQGNVNKDDRGKGNDNNAKGNEGKGNDGKTDERGNENKGKDKKNESDYGYNWDRETFKDRDKIRKQEKVTICHKINRNDEPPVTIRVSSNALNAHLNHGDVKGDCPDVDNTRYSDDFLNRRKDYYNSLQESQEQVIYSRSILDYALQRLSSSRLQLASMKANNVPQTELERKQATVVELEQNVSALEIVLGAAATLIANKLQ